MNGFVKSCALALAACLLAGCAPSLPPQPTLDELLAEVNAAHQAVDKPQGDAGQGQYLHLRPGPDEETLDYFTSDLTKFEFDPDAELTAAQAAEDVEYLFDAFRTLYGPYDYFGGDETFGEHKAELLAKLEEKESWTAIEVQNLLVGELGFLKDGHFNINGERTNLFQVPFFFREVAFYKTEEGDYISEKGKRVASVDGYSDLDELFKRSISPEGKIVYYPVLLQERNPFKDQSEPQICDEALTVRYANGSTQTLTAEPFQIYYKEIEGGGITEYHKDGEIPVFTFNECDINAISEIEAGAIMVAKYPVGVVDLRSNLGGNSRVTDRWLWRYLGQLPPVNQCIMNVFTGISNVADAWIENDRVLIVLTGKWTVSSAEMFVDQAHNVENVLFVGENTFGAQVTSAETNLQLPNSKCFVVMGSGRFHTPQDWNYFEELRGFYPDLWVPADEAEELAVKLMENLGAVQAEGEASSPAA